MLLSIADINNIPNDSNDHQQQLLINVEENKDGIDVSQRKSKVYQIVENDVDSDQLLISRQYSLSNLQKKIQSFIGYEENTICPICYLPLIENNQITFDCCGAIFCDACPEQYLNNKILNSQVIDIGCPNAECDKKQLSDEKIKHIVTPENYEKMLKFRKVISLSQNTNIRFCTRPDCEFFVEKQNNEEEGQCQCGQIICFNCGNSKHQGQSCKDVIDNSFKQAIKAYQSYILTIISQIQKCPKCKSPIQKSDGCNHMTCQHCRHEFCWLCRGKYSYKHYSDYNILGCPSMQYSDQQPFKHPYLYRFIIILLVLIFGLPICGVIFVLGSVFFIFALPLILMDNLCNIWQKYKNYHCCKQITVGPLLVITSIVLSPITLALMAIVIALTPIVLVFYGIYALFYCLCSFR